MDYAKMNTIAQDPSRVRSMAEKILETPDYKRKESTEKFLKWLATYKGDKLLNTRQKEALYSLYRRSTKKAFAGKYSAAELLKLAFERRFDLNDEDQEYWLEQKISYRQSVLLTNEEWLRLIHLCRRLELIYPDEWIPLDE